MAGRGLFLAVKVFALTLDRLLPLIWALLFSSIWCTNGPIRRFNIPNVVDISD